MRIMQGSELASYQDSLFREYSNLGYQEKESHLRILRENLWVKVAHRTAPSNLTIRNIVLEDLLSDCDENRHKIIKQFINRFYLLELKVIPALFL